MARLVFIAALVFVAYLALQWARALPPAGRRRAARYGLMGAPLIVLAWLIVTGRLSWLFALLAHAWLLLTRAWRMLMMVAALRRLLGRVGMGQGRGPSGTGGPGRPPRGGPGAGAGAGAEGGSGAASEVEQAYAVLGLSPGASREEILQAHRRLIQKMHPDVGGSDYLAATINRARDLLLERTRH